MMERILNLKQLTYIITAPFIVCFFLIGQVRAQDNVSPLPTDLDQYIEQVQERFEVPGMSLAVVKDGKPILTKGYGRKKLDASERVDEHTLFFIGSNSKSFTALALALLIQDDKLEWDKPVIDYLPWFRLSDPYITQEITVRDLIVHRSGLSSYLGDLLQFPPTTYTRKELVERLKYLPVQLGFRNKFAYNNLLYLVAAELIEEVSGLEWEEFVQERILEKMRMTQTLSRFSSFESAENIAAPHARFGSDVRHLENFYQQGLSDLSNPAGGIASNAVDMARYLLFYLDSGRTESGDQLLRPSLTSDLWRGVIPMPVNRVPNWIAPVQADFRLYAMGFMEYTYRNQRVICHGGKLDGFVSNMYFFPELDLGIAIMLNHESSNAYNSVVNYIADHVMGVAPFDWLAGYTKQEELKLQRYVAMEQKAIQRNTTDSSPSLPLEKYAGKYMDSWYGDITIDYRDGKLIVKFDRTPLLVGEAEHWQYDTFIVRWYNRELRADAFLNFSLGIQGEVVRIKMDAISPVTDVSYDFKDLDIVPVDSK